MGRGGGGYTRWRETGEIGNNFVTSHIIMPGKSPIMMGSWPRSNVEFHMRSVICDECRMSSYVKFDVWSEPYIHYPWIPGCEQARALIGSLPKGYQLTSRYWRKGVKYNRWRKSVSCAHSWFNDLMYDISKEYGGERVYPPYKLYIIPWVMPLKLY